MKFNVTFRSSLAVDFDQHPIGEELAEFLIAKLRDNGFNVVLSENSPDYAWELEFDEPSPAPWLLVGYVGDGDYEWLLQINSGISWLGRLLGRSDADLRKATAIKLHEILTNDAQFGEVRWHAGDFADSEWSAHPDG